MMSDKERIASLETSVDLHEERHNREHAVVIDMAKDVKTILGDHVASKVRHDRTDTRLRILESVNGLGSKKDVVFRLALPTVGGAGAVSAIIYGII